MMHNACLTFWTTCKLLCRVERPNPGADRPIGTVHRQAVHASKNRVERCLLVWTALPKCPDTTTS